MIWGRSKRGILMKYETKLFDQSYLFYHMLDQDRCLFKNYSMSLNKPDVI